MSVEAAGIGQHPDRGTGKIELSVTLDRAGTRILEVSIKSPSGDEIPENDTRYIATTVTRDRVRVLHVAGRPTYDVRALRMWLKSDASIDLVAFFILRTPDDDVNASQDDLALIPFEFGPGPGLAHFTLTPGLTRHDGVLYGGTGAAAAVMLMESVTQRDARWVATGHYARVRQGALHRGLDPAKDQSYFLWGIDRAVLSRLLPIGWLTKAETRERARKMGLRVVAEKVESQDICFVPDGDHARVVAARLGSDAPALARGNFVRSNGVVVGEHDGFVRYTVGQRRGLPGGFAQPMFVTEIRAATREVVIGPREELLGRRREHVDIDRARCTVLGVNPSDAATVARIAVDGAVATRVRTSTGLVDVREVAHFQGDRSYATAETRSRSASWRSSHSFRSCSRTCARIDSARERRSRSESESASSKALSAPSMSSFITLMRARRL